MTRTSQIKEKLHTLPRIQTWQLVVLLIISGFISATFLRLNNIGMVQRREAVISADVEGDIDTITQRLYDLQHYVSAHMNTDLGRGVYLEQSYNRDLQGWQQKQYGDSNPNGNIYKKAQEVCAPQFHSYSYAYLQCTTNELAKYPSASTPATDTSKPRQETYIHAFSSPIWTPDFAGWATLITLVILVVLVVRVVGSAVLSLVIRRRSTQL